MMCQFLLPTGKGSYGLNSIYYSSVCRSEGSEGGGGKKSIYFSKIKEYFVLGAIL